ncbi:MAG: hypothetical protein IJZ95_00955 [Oscillospiraceae bacterium]|nr:hypothetical protein [Oscillospiraceae bacterium]
MAQYKTVQLTGTEQRIKLIGQNCDIRNDGTDTVYISRTPDIVPDADGVVSVPSGQAVKYHDINGTVCLLGTGKVTLCGNDHTTSVFRAAATSSGGGGADQTARDAINDLAVTVAQNRTEYDGHAGNAGIHLTSEKALEAAANAISNPNHLINPDFRINQRGKTEYTETGYTIDHWHKLHAAATVQLTDNGIRAVTKSDLSQNITVLRQVFAEELNIWRGKTVTLTAKVTETHDRAAMAVICSSATQNIGPKIALKVGINKISLTIPDEALTLLDVRLIINSGSAAGDAFTVEWVKLEAGPVPTPFCPPDPATELMKCQRYYQIRTTGDIDPVDLRPTMRKTPSVTQLADGNYAYNAEN